MRRFPHKQKSYHFGTDNHFLEYPSQMKSEIDIKRKNMTKLIFHDSEDSEEDNSAQKQKIKDIQKPVDLKMYRSRLQHEYKAESTLLKPSLMSWSREEDDYIEDVKCSTLPMRKQISLPNSQRKMRWFQPSTRLKTEQKKEKEINPEVAFVFENKIDEKEVKQIPKEDLKKQDPILIPKMNIANNFYFSISDEEDEEMPLPETIQTQPAQAHHSSQQRETQWQDEEGSLENSSVTNDAQLHSSFNILQLDSEVQRKSRYFQDKLLNLAEQADQTEIMYIPIAQGCKINFQVHVTNSLMQKVYELWLDQGREMVLLMKTTKCMKINKTQFNFLTYLPKYRQFADTCIMTSNMDRNQFNIETSKSQKRSRKIKILGTISNVVRLKGQKCLMLYFPRLDQVSNHQTSIIKTSEFNSLQKLFRDNKTQVVNNVDFLITAKLEQLDRNKIINNYGCVASQKSMEFKDSKGVLKLVIGKKQSKRYRVVAGPGITPIQIFGIVITQIQT